MFWSSMEMFWLISAFWNTAIDSSPFYREA
jgi:hypothetical protein